VRRVEAEFEERPAVDEQVNALAGCQARLGVLALDRLRASAFADLLLFVADLCDQIGERSHIGFEAERAGVNLGSEDVADIDSGGIGFFAH